MKPLMLLTTVGASILASALEAQVTPARPDSSCTKYSDGRVECRVIRRDRIFGDSAFRGMIFRNMDSAMVRRAALGIELRATGTKRDTLGVFVEAVTPRGPAENAGIFEGERIASINGVDVRSAAADVEDPYTNGLAAHKLSREVQKLTPGTRVTLRVYSGGRFRDVQVTTVRASDVMRLGNRFRYGMPGGMMQFDGPGDEMRLGPDIPLMMEHLQPLLRDLPDRLAPLMRDLPNRVEPGLRPLRLPRPTVQVRSPARTRTLAPRVFRVLV